MALVGLGSAELIVRAVESVQHPEHTVVLIEPAGNTNPMHCMERTATRSYAVLTNTSNSA